jgi:UDP-N-acetylmuramate dehydrogenase
MKEQHVALKTLNTFGIEVFANELYTFHNVDELISILKEIKDTPNLILGGGSNILFTKNCDVPLLLNRIKGISIDFEDENSITLKVGAGEVWHELVLYCIENNYAGLENLSLIPGRVGASPMQNIGAYGVEVKDLIVKVEAIDKKSLQLIYFTNSECEFAYRESVFKRKYKDKFVITHVYFKLSKNPKINTSYGAIEAELQKNGITQPTIKDVSNAVINIRQSKLPDPNIIGNAGSFFKNPTITIDLLQKIIINYPDIPHFKLEAETYKIPAGWLIENAGWKGKTYDCYGVHKNQALVLVNYGGATGKQIIDLSQAIIDDIKDKFSIELEREVNVF